MYRIISVQFPFSCVHFNYVFFTIHFNANFIRNSDNRAKQFVSRLHTSKNSQQPPSSKSVSQGDRHSVKSALSEPQWQQPWGQKVKRKYLQEKWTRTSRHSSWNSFRFPSDQNCCTIPIARQSIKRPYAPVSRWSSRHSSADNTIVSTITSSCDLTTIWLRESDWEQMSSKKPTIKLKNGFQTNR